MVVRRPTAWPLKLRRRGELSMNFGPIFLKNYEEPVCRTVGSPKRPRFSSQSLALGHWAIQGLLKESLTGWRSVLHKEKVEGVQKAN
jgi:hypothetical protein